MENLRKFLEDAAKHLETKTKDGKTWTSFTMESLKHSGDPVHVDISCAIYEYEGLSDDGYTYAGVCLDWLVDEFDYLSSGCETTEEFWDKVDERFGEMIDNYVDVYTWNLLQWFAGSIDNIGFVEDELSDYGYNKDNGFARVLTGAQYRAIESVTVNLINKLKKTYDLMYSKD